MDNSAQPKLASDYAYQTLYNKIVSLELSPGESISPVQLSKELGISRTPIQKASAKLAEDGLLEVLPQRGSYVSQINIDRIYESFYMRNLVEQAAVIKICDFDDRKDVCMQLEQNIYNQKKVLERELYEESFEIDEQFHHIIYKAANMLYIEKALAQISADQNRLRKLKVLSNMRADPTLQEHNNILESIRGGKAEEAALNIYKHISKFAGDTIAIHDKYPEYFSNWKNAEIKNLKLKKQSFFSF
ncbi:GntR family transcriptional regulator [Companilactobacillus keshanensis]|uniref:GntR family transcriptional regulator n=1 Tax=Companilactobacillus keshanensis TaxID=2486003 RepID=A0ABW4BSI2_9LACO|nr:GntR family transcriptional regulator [Companilactobacillus keshanensis]